MGKDQWVYTAPVGQFPANPFGLYDMLGNVHEWVHDCFYDSYKDAPSDGTPAKETTGCLRIIRGGSWYEAVSRIASRSDNAPLRREVSIGFRVARSLD